jgi:pyridoxal phosphate enzyme (YggS family)
MNWNIKELLKDIPSDVTLVAATKYFTVEQMKEAYQEGIRHFGENRVESLLSKHESFNDYPVTWHYIGTLQTKKVKKIIHLIDYLHSLDTMKLAQEIDKRRQRPLPCFVQVNISGEESKHGLKTDQVLDFCQDVSKLKNIEIIGLMGMAVHSEDKDLIAQQFKTLKDLKTEINSKTDTCIQQLSMGMSNDYQIAIQEGATHIRLGSILFRSE